MSEEEEKEEEKLEMIEEKSFQNFFEQEEEKANQLYQHPFNQDSPRASCQEDQISNGYQCNSFTFNHYQQDQEDPNVNYLTQNINNQRQKRDYTRKANTQTQSRSKNIPKSFGNHLYRYLLSQLQDNIKKDNEAIRDFINKRTQNYSFTIKDHQTLFMNQEAAQIARDYYLNYLLNDLVTSQKAKNQENFINFIDKFVWGTLNPRDFTTLSD